jgi:hypothetical protein
VTPRLTLLQGGGASGPRDDDAVLASELRAMLAPPNGAEDFAALERRILDAVELRPGSPVPLLARWARVAVAAAIGAVVLSGFIEWRMRQQEARIPLWAAVAMPVEAAEGTVRGEVAREMTLREMLER